MATTLVPLTGKPVITTTSAPTMGQFNRYDATSGPLTMTLPALSGLNVGARLAVQKYMADLTTNDVTFNCAGSDKFDDGTTTTLVLAETSDQRELQVVSISGAKRWAIVGTQQSLIGDISSTSTGSSFEIGVPKITSGATQFGIPHSTLTSTSTVALSANTVRYNWFRVDSTISVTGWQFEVTTGPASSANARIGIYAADTDLQPTGAPLLDSGNVAVASGFTGVKNASSLSIVLRPGIYLAAINCNVAMTVRTLVGGGSFVVPAFGSTAVVSSFAASQTFSAFPISGTRWATVNTGSGTNSVVAFQWKIGDIVYVANYATPQLAANAASGKRLVFPASTTYTVSSLMIPANCYVEGNDSTIKFADNSTTGSTHSDEIMRINGSGVTIDNLNFNGNSTNQAVWSQFRHCIRLQDVFSDLTVKNCDFTNLIGDGVYINAQTGSNIKIGPDNTFTANYDARNGVSVVSGDTVEVYSNTFTTISRNGMPGAIDVEPNFNTDHLAHVDVHHNTINGGTTTGTGQISGILYAGMHNPPAVDIKIRNNDISGTRITKALYAKGVDGGPFNSVTGLVFDSNNIHGMWVDGTAVQLDYWIGATITNNTFNGMYYGIGNYQACILANTGNTFTGVGVPVVEDTPHCS